MTLSRLLFFILLMLGATPWLSAQYTLEFGPAVNVSDTPAGTARSDYRIVVDPVTLEKIHVVTYADGRNGERDIFVRYSTDGVTWSSAINVSNTAQQTNVLGEPGNSRRPAIAASGGRVLISWVDKYCPGGAQGTYVAQGGDTLAFGCIYAARSIDAGRTWSGAEILTDGSRDAINPFPAAGSAGFALAWQEDPAGVPGGGEEGSPGARGSPGSDIHYSALSFADFSASAVFPAAVQVSDNTGTADGDPSATRPHLKLAGATALLGYEETKSGAQGKNVHWHDFPFLTPPSNAVGAVLNDPAENARRIRLVGQTPMDSGPSGTLALAIWRQGVETREAPADLMLRRAVGGYGIAQMAPAVNLSGTTLDEPTSANPEDSIRGHRAILSGDFAAVAYIYTPSEALRALQQANYNTMTRRSLDGGATWSPAHDLSVLQDTTLTTFAPRIVGTPPTIPTGEPEDMRDPGAYFVGWDVRTNAADVHDAGKLDAFVSVTGDFGGLFSAPIPVADSMSEEFELGLQAFPSGTVLCAIWKQRDPGLNPDTWFRCGDRFAAPVIVPSLSTWGSAALVLLILITVGRLRRRLV